ncbi:hypothetical protein [Lampropedia aestuarii]|uniref:hypothetical protein n=1 Tax=Lampropedia aestuarii TaxID=2562762 RepID=UPI00246978FC|nr:hypothetical protein [Lampropedia aestuarii]MDH5858247.1 hypothetical protein [Lampropedia aestuarii]
MKKFLLPGLLLLATFTKAETTFLYTQPFVYEVDSILRNNPISGFTQNIAGIATYDVGITDQIPKWNVSDFTGLQIPDSEKFKSERTVDATWYGSTAIQTYNNSIATQLHTYSSPYRNDRSLKTISINLDFSEDRLARPWNGDYGQNAKLCMGFFAAVPSSWTGDGSHNESGANFSLRDISTGRYFTIGALLYSSSGATEYIGFDGGAGSLNIPMVSTYFGSQNFITTTPGSASSRTATWDDDTYFGFCLTRQNIELIVNEVNKNYPNYNFTVENLVLGTANLGSEISTGDPNAGELGRKDGHMATRFTEWTILIEN